MIDVDALARQAEPLAFVRALGWKPARGSRADHAITCCPLHADKTPSFHVTIGPGGTPRGTCFGGCGTFDLIGMTAIAHGLSAQSDFARVAQLAAEAVGANIETTDETDRRPRPLPQPLPPRQPLDLDGELATVLRPLDPNHLGEVERWASLRGILDLCAAAPESARAVDLPELEHLIAERDGIGGNPLECPIGVAGLVGEGDHGFHVRFAQHRLCLIWRTPDGEIDTVQRRRVDANESQKYVFPKDRGPLHLFGVERLAGAAVDAELVIVEGGLDVLARRELGGASGRVVLGLPGASGWKSEWASFAGGRAVFIATDDDKAGDDAAATIAADVWAAGAVSVFRERSVGADWVEVLAARGAA